MAFINYVTEADIPPQDRVADRDNILQIHGIHSRTMGLHFELYRELMPLQQLFIDRKQVLELARIFEEVDAHLLRQHAVLVLV